jgi:hypothetical protein
VNAQPAASARSWLDRALGAYPVVVAYALLLFLYAWQTTRHPTPWLFTDELQWAGLSRGVAHHGVPELRLEHWHSSSLYTYLIAPAWWFGATGPSYAAAKYINAAVMAASLFPGYALARLVVPRTAAMVVGVATAAIPALAYTSLLIPESLAYFWATLTLWLVMRAYIVRTRGAIIAAVIVTFVAPFVRSQLAVLALAALITGIVMAVTSSEGQARIRAWSLFDRIGAAVLILGGLIWIGALANHHSYSWQIGAHFHHRMFTYGLWAIGAFTIGVGVLPALGALTWLLGGRFRTVGERALAGSLIGAIVGFGLYTAVKASYLSTNFAIRVEERNLIYISPVVFAATACWLLYGRSRLIPLIISSGIVGWLLWSTPYHNYEKFYSDAPGLSILQWLNQQWYFTTTDARRLLFGVLIGSILLALLREQTVRRDRFLRTGLVVVAALGALGIAWNLAGEIQAANASDQISKSFRGVLPTPPDWIDNTTGRERTMFIGQSLAGSDAFWSLEFWNQSIGYVWSVDASAPGPGPVRTPNYLDTTGAIDPQVPIKWMVATPGVDPVGKLKETAGGLRLYRVTHPIRIADAEGGVSTDAAWMGTSSWYYRFTSAGTKPGVATVQLSRAAACGSFPPSRITVRLSSLRIDSDGQPVAKRLLATRRVTLRSNPCQTKVVSIPARAPFRIDVTAVGTFQPSQFDQRELSAQVTYGFH